MVRSLRCPVLPRGLQQAGRPRIYAVLSAGHALETCRTLSGPVRIISTYTEQFRQSKWSSTESSDLGRKAHFVIATIISTLISPHSAAATIADEVSALKPQDQPARPPHTQLLKCVDWQRRAQPEVAMVQARQPPDADVARGRGCEKHCHAPGDRRLEKPDRQIDGTRRRRCFDIDAAVNWPIRVKVEAIAEARPRDEAGIRRQILGRRRGWCLQRPGADGAQMPGCA